MSKSDKDRLEKIVSVYSQLTEIIDRRNITADSILCDRETQWIVTVPLYEIGEHVNNLSSQLTNTYPDVPWAQIAGLRHRHVHDYDDTNWHIIVKVIFDRLPVFIDQVDQILTALKKG